MLFGKSKAKGEEPSTDPEDNSQEETKDSRPLSTTLMLLISNKEKASEQFIKAEKAEKAYRLNKRAALGREGWNETKTHFREAVSHFKLAFKGLFSAIVAIPSIMSDRGHQKKQKADGKRREKILERQKKLQDALDKAEVEEEGKEYTKKEEDTQK